MSEIITIQRENYAYKLLKVLSVAGEFPAQSLHILGDMRTLKALVHKLESVQDIRINGKNFRVQLLSVSGRREKRTIRFHKQGLEVLNELHPEALDYYLNSYNRHRFSGQQAIILRNHRVAECLAMMIAASIEIRPYMSPALQLKNIQNQIEKPCSYPSKFIKTT